jgi:hypothetical protein
MLVALGFIFIGGIGYALYNKVNALDEEVKDIKSILENYKR